MSSSAVRMGLAYALTFGATGVSLPFAALWFEQNGLTGAEIAVILAVPMLLRVVTGPLTAVWADGFKLRRSGLAWLYLVAAVGYGACGLVTGFGPWLIFWTIAATAAASIIPLTDALALRLARREGFLFSWARSAGSVAFILANVAMGFILRRWDADAIIIWIAAFSALGALLTLTISREPVRELAEAPAEGRFRGLGRLLGDHVFMTAILAVGLIQAAHAFYYGFSAVIWREQGIGTRDIGLLWAFSVAVEVLLMWVVEPWRRRRGIGPLTVLMVGGAASIARWGLLALSPPLWALWPLQALHALSFAAVFLAALQIIERLVPSDQATAGQSLYSTLSAGVLIGLATMVSGPLYDAFGAMGYLAMVGVAAAGLIAAWSVRREIAVV